LKKLTKAGRDTKPFWHFPAVVKNPQMGKFVKKSVIAI
jgi:hypothetical protein